jgi:hypothetical protein
MMAARPSVSICVFLPLLAPALMGQTFQSSIQPVLEDSCVVCHNADNASGGLNIERYSSSESILGAREQWENIVQKLRTGEMPPRGIPRPSAESVAKFLAFVDGVFEKADANVKPDPGRVTASRLNRVEYSNTIRDLLGVLFHAEKDFPSDDSGHGFDNIGDVLTISPVLMEKYMDAAERIAASAIGGDPLPDKPVEAEYHLKHRTARRIDVGVIEAQHRVEWDGEYTIRIGLPGERPKDAAPVELALFMDGVKIHSQMAETKPSGLVYFDPYSVEETQLFLPAGDHTFRIAFLNDDFPNSLDSEDIYDREKNKFIESITFVGPYPSDHEPEYRKRILFCDPASGAACVKQIIAKLARGAYRRPVTDEDLAPLMGFVKMAEAEGDSPKQGIQLALQAMLVSPHFLFRIEHDPDPTNPEQVHRISDVELASRLSYFLWSSMPDEELLSLAEQGKLHEPETLHAQVDRMLADERSEALATNFAGQWLETRNLDHVNPDPDKFEEWGPELKEAMRTETRMFFESILRENRPVSEFLTAKYTFLNGRLAKHYGIEGVTGPEFRRVELTTPQRTGILGQASVLTVSSYPTRTSPVIRGKYVLENILGTPPPPPPPNVPSLDENGVGTSGSLRQKLEQHRSNPVCASCHQRMDTLGFGLENYDAIGRWRSEDGDFPIDSSGTMPDGETFNGPEEMTKVLEEQMPDFVRCLTEKMLTYSLGRGLERFDRRTVEGIVKRVGEEDNRFQALVHEIVESLPFTMRRGEEVTTDNQPGSKEIARNDHP